MTIRSIPTTDLTKLSQLAKSNGRSMAAEIRMAIKLHVSRGASNGN